MEGEVVRVVDVFEVVEEVTPVTVNIEETKLLNIIDIFQEEDNISVFLEESIKELSVIDMLCDQNPFNVFVDEDCKTYNVILETNTILAFESLTKTQIEILQQPAIEASKEVLELINNIQQDKYFRYVQNLPSKTWIVTHSLNKHASVTVVDSGDTVVVGEIIYIDMNTVRIEFSTEFIGKAYFN